MQKFNITSVIQWLACSALLGATLAATDAYHVIKRIPIPDDYKWNYVTADSEGRRLYVTHEHEIVVLNLDSGAIIGTIPGGNVVTQGVAVAPEFGRGFISNGQPGSPGFVTIFDLKTLKKIEDIPVGDDPHVILFDRKTKRVFTADRGSKRVTAIDATTGKVVGTVENLGGKTEHAASDNAGHVFLNMQDLNVMLRIDAQTLKVLNTWPTGPCEQPSSMEMDRVHERIFVGCRNSTMAVFDGNTGRIITSQPIGPGVDASEFDVKRGLVYFSSGGDGTMSVFRQETPDKYVLEDRVKTQKGARTMAIDQVTGNAYLSVAEFGPRTAPVAGAAPQGRPPMVPGSFSILVVGK